MEILSIGLLILLGLAIPAGIAVVLSTVHELRRDLRAEIGPYLTPDRSRPVTAVRDHPGAKAERRDVRVAAIGPAVP